MACRRVAVIGSGTMGCGIAHVSALGGHETVMHDVSEERLRKAVATVEAHLRKGLEKGKIAPGDVESARQALRAASTEGPQERTLAPFTRRELAGRLARVLSGVAR